ncbi:MAG: hypothetical protein PUE85_00100 [Firmicutes bacterium]|nr:hypothetical protein [Bacillota bacterium]
MRNAADFKFNGTEPVKQMAFLPRAIPAETPEDLSSKLSKKIFKKIIKNGHLLEACPYYECKGPEDDPRTNRQKANITEKHKHQERENKK